MLWQQGAPDRPVELVITGIAEALVAEGIPLWRLSSALISHDPSLNATKGVTQPAEVFALPPAGG